MGLKTRSAIVFAVLPLAVGCGSTQPAYLVNDGDRLLTVSISFPEPVSVSGEAPTCRLKRNVQPLLAGQVEHAMRNEFRGWIPPILTTFDPERCEATFVLHPDMAVFVFWADERRSASGPSAIGRLKITDETGRSLVDLSGRAAEAAFKATWRDNRQLRL